MSSIQLVVFDIAGTTVQDRGNVADSFITAFQEFGFDMPRDEVKKVMGFRKIDAIRMLLEKFYPESTGSPLITRELIATVHERFIDNMISFYESDEQLMPLPHAEEVFSGLREKGIKIALNTGFTRAVTDALLHRLHWDNGFDRIDKVICSDEVARGRPSPDMIMALMASLGVSSAARILKVGDTEVDIEEGRNAGCGVVVGVTTGAYSREQLQKAHPDHIINGLQELIPIIEKA